MIELLAWWAFMVVCGVIVMSLLGLVVLALRRLTGGG